MKYGSIMLLVDLQVEINCRQFEALFFLSQCYRGRKFCLKCVSNGVALNKTNDTL